MHVPLAGVKFGLRADYRQYLSILMDHLVTQITLICLGPKLLRYVCYSRCSLPNIFQHYKLIFLCFCMLSSVVNSVSKQVV